MFSVRKRSVYQTISHCIGAFFFSILLACSSQPTSSVKAQRESSQIAGVVGSAAEISNQAHDERDGQLEQSPVQSEAIEHSPSELSVRPAILLDRSYTLQIGLYDHREEATAVVLEHQLNAEEAGIAIVTVEGSQKYLLAYGIYVNKETAEIEARQIEDRLKASVEIVLLAEIEAISETVDDTPTIRTF